MIFHFSLCPLLLQGYFPFGPSSASPFRLLEFTTIALDASNAISSLWPRGWILRGRTLLRKSGWCTGLLCFIIGPYFFSSSENWQSESSVSNRWNGVMYTRRVMWAKIKSRIELPFYSICEIKVWTIITSISCNTCADFLLCIAYGTIDALFEATFLYT